MGTYLTELRNKNRGDMRLIVWQKAMELFKPAWNLEYVEAKIERLIEKLEPKRGDEDWIARLSELPSEYDASNITSIRQYSTPSGQR